MSHIRSASVNGAVGDLDADVVGSAVHDVTVERREAYLSDWVGFRGCGGGGTEALERWERGVLIGPEGTGAGSAPWLTDVAGGIGAD